MIKKLTTDQIAKMSEYVDKYVKIGLSTERVDREFVVASINKIYQRIFQKPIVPVVILQNPLECWIAVCMFTNSQVWSQVESQVRRQVLSQVESQVKDFVHPYLDGFWSSYFSFYDYMSEVLNVDLKCSEYDLFRETLNYGMVFPLDNICIVCDRPTEIHMINGKLHNNCGPSIKYNGEFEVYSLDGNIVTDEKQIEEIKLRSAIAEMVEK